MAQCPRCGASIEADFGVINCSTCSALVSVGFDGSVSLAEEDETKPTEDVSSFIESTPDPVKSLDEVESFTQFHKQQGSIAAEISLQENAEAAKEVPADELEQWQAVPQTVNPFSNEEEDRTKVLSANNFKDVEAFGNSDLSSSQSGGLVYDIQIEGIDSKSIRSEIESVLQDPKMKLSVDILMKSIKDGKLVLRRLNPIKASIIIKSLMHLPVQIHWKQNEIIRL
jgi:hypothetical protein